MAMPPEEDHPQRYPMVAELHARPFPKITVPSHVVYLAVKEPLEAAARPREADFAHLVDLLGRHGAPMPPLGATHHAGGIGRYQLSWESRLTSDLVMTRSFLGLGSGGATGASLLFQRLI